MFKKLIAFALSMAMLASFTACGQSTSAVSKEQASAQTTTDDKKKSKVDTLVIAYLPNEAKEDLAEHRQGLAKDMEAALGVKVKEFLASDYNAAIEAMRTGKADIAFFGPLSYSQAHERAKAEPLVITSLDGKKENSGYYSYIVVNAKNDKIKTVADLKGKKFAFVDANSTSGNLVPSYEILKVLKDDKLTFEDLHTNGKFFESVSFSGAHQNGLQAVLKGDIDAAPCASDIYNRELQAGKFKESDVRIIHKSPKIPDSPIAIRGDLPEDFKKAVREFYLKYDNDNYFIKFMGQKPGEKKRFIPAEDADYKEVYELRKKFGL